MFKNVASQTLTLSAFDSATGTQKTGDAANLVFYVDIDDAGPNAITSNSGVPSEISSTNSKGDYKIALSQGETNGNKLHFTGKSSTSGIVVVSKTIYTLPTTGLLAPATAGRTVVVDAAGLVDANTVKVGPTGSGTAQTARDLGASVLLSSGTGTGQVKLSSGYVAPNWGDVGNPTTTLNLSGTTVKTATDIATYLSTNLGALGAALSAVPKTGFKLASDGLAQVTAWTVALTGDITGSLSGSVGSLTNAPPDSPGVTTLLTRVTGAVALAATFTGITSLAQWLGLIAGKQAGNSTAKSEIQLTGAGAGTYDETTDSLQALRDRGDAAWTGGGSAPTASDIADEVATREHILTAAYDAAKDAASQGSVDALPDAAAIVDAIKAYSVENNLTFDEAMKLIAAACVGNVTDPLTVDEAIAAARNPSTPRIKTNGTEAGARSPTFTLP